ncbi:MAG: C40 family peptidase [Capnocytophaga sp.]|nr:C40 family peptidase [Capnocytophaga sp.]
MKKILYISPFLLISCITQQKVAQQTREPRTIIDNPIYLENDNIEDGLIPNSNTIIDLQNTFAENNSLKSNYFSDNPKINTLMDTAYSFLGTPYKYAGTTRAGMDCSGFVSTAYQSVDVKLSRSSSDMANQGTEVPLSQVVLGDLLFFKTSKKKRINHVGIVVETGNEIKFIHSSTSKGVITSSLSEPYWKKSYIKAKRVLN